MSTGAPQARGAQSVGEVWGRRGAVLGGAVLGGAVAVAVRSLVDW